MWRLRPTWRPAEAGAQQQLRGAEGAAGGDHRAPGADREGALASRSAPRAVQATPTARPSSTRTRCASTPGAHPRAGGDGARQVADVHAALGVDRAAEGAGAALDAAAGVAGDRAAAGAERGGSLHRQLAVAPHPLGVERGDPEELLRLGEVGVEVARPGDPNCRASSPAPVGGAEAGAGVDHRGAADDLRHRDGDRRPAGGDRQAGVAVELGDRFEAVGRVVVAVVVVAGLEHDDVEARLGQRRRGDRAARARADDHHVAFLALAAGARVAEEPAGSGSEPSASPQRISKPILASTSGATA